MAGLEEIKRIMAASGFEYQKDLALALGVAPSELSNAKRMRALPNRFLHSARENLGLRPHWIRTGQGPVYEPWNHQSEAERDVGGRRAVREVKADVALVAARLEGEIPEHAVLDRPVTVDSVKILENTAEALGRIFERPGLTLETAAVELADDVAALIKGDVSLDRRLAVLANAVALAGA